MCTTACNGGYLAYVFVLCQQSRVKREITDEDVDFCFDQDHTNHALGYGYDVVTSPLFSSAHHYVTSVVITKHGDVRVALLGTLTGDLKQVHERSVLDGSSVICHLFEK